MPTAFQQLTAKQRAALDQQITEWLLYAETGYTGLMNTINGALGSTRRPSE